MAIARMKNLKTVVLPIVLIALSSQMISGCIYSRELAQSKRIIENGYPDLDLDRKITLAIGPRLLHSAGWIARRVPEEEAFLAGNVLKHIDRVKVAVYDVDYYDAESRSSNSAVVDFEKNGWTLAVRSNEDDESVWVLYREDSRANVRSIKVVVLSEDELVIARVEGMLNDLLDEVVRDQDIIKNMM